MFPQASRFDQSENFEFWFRLMSHVQSDDDVYRNPASVFPPGEGRGPDPAAMDDAAEALRAEEVVADSEVPPRDSHDGIDLEGMNIDELRIVAKELDVPDPETILEREELIAAIRKHS